MAFSSTRGLLGAAGGAAAGLVKSVQQHTITIGSAALTNTATLSPSVDTSNCLVIFNGTRTNDTGNSAQSVWSCLVELTNSTTLTARRATSTTPTCTVVATVIEFNSGVITSRQEFTAQIDGGQTIEDTTITAVTLADTSLVLSGTGRDNGVNINGADEFAVRSELTSTTNVRITRTSTFNPVQARVQVIEWDTSLLDSIQRLNTAYALSSGTDTTTITSVDTSRAVLLYGGWDVSASGNAQVEYVRNVLTNGTTITHNAGGSSSASGDTSLNVVEFLSGDVASLQRGVITIANGTSSNDATITSVDTSKAAVIWSGHEIATSGTTNAASSLLPTVELLNSTTVRAQMGNNAPGGPMEVPYQVIEFN